MGESTVAINWQPGDLCLWDNRNWWHSVTPTELYYQPEDGVQGSRDAEKGTQPWRRRLMMRMSIPGSTSCGAEPQETPGPLG